MKEKVWFAEYPIEGLTYAKVMEKVINISAEPTSKSVDLVVLSLPSTKVIISLLLAFQPVATSKSTLVEISRKYLVVGVIVKPKSSLGRRIRDTTSSLIRVDIVAILWETFITRDPGSKVNKVELSNTSRSERV